MNENLINELLERDPLELTKEDISIVAAFYRKQRENFKVEEASAQKEGRKVRPSKVKLTSSETANLLDSLEL